MIGLEPPGGVYTHIVGIDLVRVAEDQFYVLEDNARTPSGVSYMLENRETMLQMFPELFGRIKGRGVGDYPLALRRSLGASMPRHASGDGAVAVLTPGIHNSAYFEHAFLADHMGVELVEGSDLRVVDGKIAMRTTRGYKPIDVLYRRVDDDFLDPLSFRSALTLTACLVCQGLWMFIAQAASPLPTRLEQGLPMIRRSIPTCPRLSNSIRAKSRLWKMCRLGGALRRTHWPMC